MLPLHTPLPRPRPRRDLPHAGHTAAPRRPQHPTSDILLGPSEKASTQAKKHCPDNSASRGSHRAAFHPSNHHHRPASTTEALAHLHLHAHPLLIARHHHPRSFPVLLIRRHLLTLRGHAEVLASHLLGVGVVPILISLWVPERGVGRARLCMGGNRRGVGLVMLIFRWDVVSRGKGRGEVVHHVRGSLAVHVRDGRDRGDHLGLRGHIGLGGSTTLPLAGRQPFLRSSGDGCTLSDGSGGFGLLGIDVALAVAVRVYGCGARLRVGSLCGRSHGSRGSGSELVRSDGESAVLGLRSGDRSGEGLSVGAIPVWSVETCLQASAAETKRLGDPARLLRGRRTHLDQILALRLLDQRLQLGRGERVHESRFRDDE
jgi:hypothetical protein